MIAEERIRFDSVRFQDAVVRLRRSVQKLDASCLRLNRIRYDTEGLGDMRRPVEDMLGRQAHLLAASLEDLSRVARRMETAGELFGSTEQQITDQLQELAAYQPQLQVSETIHGEKASIRRELLTDQRLDATMNSQKANLPKR